MKRPKYCPICSAPAPFNPDLEFVDETGFVTDCCGSNVFYDDLLASA